MDSTIVSDRSQLALTDGADERHGAALTAFRRAAQSSPGYSRWLATHGVSAGQVESLDHVPYLAKQDVFGGRVSDWIVGGRASAAAELLTSSGRGGSFSIGVTSRAEQRALAETTDAALRSLGASEASATLLLNCLPMGITVPTTVATVASPSVHLEMAQEIYERLGPEFERVLILAEPVFLKEFAERLFADHGHPWTATSTGCIVGGEWVSESWRRYVGGLLGMHAPSEFRDIGILISMGAAEIGLNLLFETAELRALRSLLDENDHGTSLVTNSLGYTPTLFTYDPQRLFVEERKHPDGATTLAFTALERRLIPLVRYDLGDMGEIVDPDRVNAAFDAAHLPMRVESPIIAFWGRHSDGIHMGERPIRPERIKQRIFSLAAEAAVLTGRFFLESGAQPALHLQTREGTVPTPNMADDFRSFMRQITGTECDVRLHSHEQYPFHASGDFQHKPRYHSVT